MPIGKIYILLLLSCIAIPARSQIAECKVTLLDTKHFFNGTTYVVWMNEGGDYKGKLTQAMKSFWKLSNYRFISGKQFLEEGFLEEHRNDFFLFWRNSPTSYNPPSIFLIKGEHLSIDQNTLVAANFSYALSYYDFMVSQRYLSDMKSANVKELADFKSFLHKQLGMAVISIQAAIKVRQQIWERKCRDETDDCIIKISDLLAQMNKPELFKNKTLLINARNIDRLTLKDLEENLSIPFKLVNFEKYYKIIEEKNPDYVALYTVWPLSRTFSVNILDLQTDKYLYARIYNSSFKLGKKHLKHLNKVLENFP